MFRAPEVGPLGASYVSCQSLGPTQGTFGSVLRHLREGAVSCERNG